MSQAEPQAIPDNLWTGATFKDTGKAFQVAIDEALKFRPELDRDNPIDTAFLTGLGYLLTLADNQLASIRVRGFKRDLPAVTEKVRGELSGLRQRIKENTMTVKDCQITKMLDELGISDRVALPISDLKLGIHLRDRGIEARFTQAGEVTVLPHEVERASKLAEVWQDYPTDWIAEGRRLIGRVA